MIDPGNDTAFQQRMLDVLGARARATLHNIANQNVEGFKRYTVRFEDLLRDAQDQGQDLATVQPVTERDESGAPGQNNVVLMDELAALNKTQLLQEVMTRRIGGYYATINKAIAGRG